MSSEIWDESGPWTEEMSKVTTKLYSKAEWTLVSKPGEWPEVRVSKDGKMEMRSTDNHPCMFAKYLQKAAEANE